MEVFGDYAYYYNSFYRDKNYAAEAGIVDKLLKKYSSNNLGKILNMGCGTGRHDLELWRLGYHVHGIDISETMIEVAKRQLENIDKNELVFEVGDICSYYVQDTYDSVISLFHVMSYQTGNDVHLRQPLPRWSRAVYFCLTYGMDRECYQISRVLELKRWRMKRTY